MRQVWTHLKERFMLSKKWMVERNAAVISKFERMDDALIGEYENCAQTFEVRF